MKNKLWIALVLITFLSACELHDKEDYEATAGTADFTTYVSIGNSLTSGFMHGELSLDGQFLSFPQQLALQFAGVGGGVFRQPLMKDNTGFGNRIVMDLPTPHYADDKPNPENKINIYDEGPFNNMGVPGAKIGDLTSPSFGSTTLPRPYYSRFASSVGQSTIMEDAMAQNPTFVTFWAGSNDVLGYALRGGDVSTKPSEAITSQSDFRTRFQAAIDALGETQTMVANISSIDVIPYFSMGNTLDALLNLNLYTKIPLTQEQADMANAAIKKAEDELLAQGITHSYGVTFAAGTNNPSLVEEPDSELPEGYRFRTALATDGFVLQLIADYRSFTNEVKVNGLGVVGSDGQLRPFLNKHVLSQTEKDRISEAITGYNAIIADIVSKKSNLHLVDMFSYMDKLKGGITQNNIIFNTNYLGGGFFSLDGVHPEGAGYSVIANKFIEDINLTFGASIPLIDVSTVGKKK